MKTVVFLLEEPSAAEFLKGLIETNIKVDPVNLNIQYKIFEGKQDLEKNLKRVIKLWKTPDTTFLIMRDQDAGDCKIIKNGLVKECEDSGRSGYIVRVACRELESFYLGDLAAVEEGLELQGIKGRQGTKKFRTPDYLHSPSKELSRITKGRYQKISGSRAIASFLKPSLNTSHSFSVLYKSLIKILSG